MNGIRDAIGGALATAAFSTAGDYLWANVIPHHRPVYGLTHGALLFLVVGLCLGAVSRKPGTGAIGGALIGLIASGGFYVLRPVMGYSAMFVLYIGVWVALGLLTGRVLREGRASLSREPQPIREALVRSALAAVGSGVAFYAISGIWFPFNPHGWDYAVHFVSWTVAYLPGFAALLVRRRESVP